MNLYAKGDIIPLRAVTIGAYSNDIYIVRGHEELLIGDQLTGLPIAFGPVEPKKGTAESVVRVKRVLPKVEHTLLVSDFELADSPPSTVLYVIGQPTPGTRGFPNRVDFVSRSRRSYRLYYGGKNGTIVMRSPEGELISLNTNLPTNTASAAVRICREYLKIGLLTELDRQSSSDVKQRLLALVLKMSFTADRFIPADHYFNSEERDRLIQINLNLNAETPLDTNPFARGTLIYSAWTVAKVGGWSSGTTATGIPSLSALMKGLQLIGSIT